MSTTTRSPSRYAETVLRRRALRRTSTLSPALRSLTIARYRPFATLDHRRRPATGRPPYGIDLLSYRFPYLLARATLTWPTGPLSVVCDEIPGRRSFPALGEGGGCIARSGISDCAQGG
ncbi:hypothetical protein GCM10022220_25170 [Actinocatenispora rupis]|uniref:Uncharacterized protein n=1 Tax=Actinocatenispora rupis TaxID=519421 RepID=A0A8J3JFZ4_9ACTN|nr:hypothetical protein Aru02nite_61120 [Actinocatenispora rupis]